MSTVLADWFLLLPEKQEYRFKFKVTCNMEVPARTQKREAGACLELELKDSGQGERGGGKAAFGLWLQTCG